MALQGNIKVLHLDLVTSLVWGGGGQLLIEQVKGEKVESEEFTKFLFTAQSFNEDEKMGRCPKLNS